MPVILLLVTLATMAARPEKDQPELNPEDASFILERVDPPPRDAIRSLAKSGGLGVSALLRVMDRLGPEERRIVAEGFRGDHARQDRVLDALHRLAEDESPPVREAAIESLEKSGSPRAGIALLGLLDSGHPDREALARAVGRFAAARRSDRARTGDKDAGTSAFEENACRSLTLLLHDPAPAVRLAAVEALETLSHPRASDLLFASVNDPDEKTSHKALRALLERREERFLEPLLSFARSLAADDRRRDLYSRIGYQYCAAYEPRFLEMFRAAANPQEKADYRRLVAGCRTPLQPEVQAALKKYAGDPDSEIRERARKILGWARENEWKQAGPAAGRHILLLTSAMSAFLGLLLFVWAFRLLKLRALLEGIGLSKARSVALGTVAVSGEAQPRGEYLKHPYTGELCLWYRGAGRSHPDHRFYVEDETGRLLLDPHDAVLLSEDGLISPGERIHLVANARRNPHSGATSDDSRRVLLGKRDERRTLHQRIADLLVGGLLGVAVGDRSIRRLFDNPQDVFWIWDDARLRPMSSPREVAFIFAVALFAGGWMVIFFLSTSAALGFNLLR